jgi:hypothetical protein
MDRKNILMKTGVGILESNKAYFETKNRSLLVNDKAGQSR